MGDRALLIFTDGSEVSPTVYLHWAGHDVPAMIEELKTLMDDRAGDVAYAAARFVGIAHVRAPGNLSLGINDTGPELADAIKKGNTSSLESASHGDAGLVVVNVEDFTWKAYGGYLEKKEAA